MLVLLCLRRTAETSSNAAQDRGIQTPKGQHSPAGLLTDRTDEHRAVSYCVFRAEYMLVTCNQATTPEPRGEDYWT